MLEKFANWLDCLVTTGDTTSTSQGMQTPLWSSQGTWAKRAVTAEKSEGKIKVSQAEGTSIDPRASQLDNWASSSVGATHQCNHQSPGNGLPRLYEAIHSPHWRIRMRLGSSTVPKTGWAASGNILWIPHSYSSGTKLPSSFQQTWISSPEMGHNWTVQRLSVLCTSFHSLHR